MYTTWQSQLQFLYDRGAITLEEKISYEKKIIGEELTEDDLNNLRDLGGLLQTTKPVYSGVIWNEENNEFTPIYIKASVLVLYPQLTKGTVLDNLRSQSF